MNKLKTISLQGKEYAQVPERVKYFNSNNPNGSIVTKPKIEGEGLAFRAYIYPDVKNMNRKFTGHSFGKLTGEKALEKLECVPLSTQILTREGFKFYHEIKVGEDVLTYNLKEDKNEWQKLEKVSVYKNASLVKMSSSRFSAVFTQDHKWVVDNGKTKKLIPFNEIELKKGNNKIILSASEEVAKGDEDASRLAWLFTDGYLRYTEDMLPTNSLIKQSKKNEIKKLKALFGEPTSIKHFDNWKDSNEWYINADEVRRILGKYKVRTYKDLPNAVSKMSTSDVKMFYQSAMDADGYDTGFAKTYYEIIEAVQICCARLGIKTNKIYTREFDNSTKPIYILPIHKGNGAYTNQLKIKNMPPADVWCPTVKNGTWVAKQNGQVWITGNTVAVGRALAFMGIMADGGIASKEEMDKFKEAEPFKGDEFKKEMRKIEKKQNIAPPLSTR
ncbi:MAG: hypothetical protein U9O91_06035 [Candidatus Caldatribacteriota bacterium]|nr:hypothetical protein [Candidatus Caldatribacteriota bacterium]